MKCICKYCCIEFNGYFKHSNVCKNILCRKQYKKDCNQNTINNNPEKYTNYDNMKNWRFNNKEKIKKAKQDWALKYPEKRRQAYYRWLDKNINNPLFKFVRNHRSRLSSLLSSSSIPKEYHTLDLIGCSRKELLEYIEKQFKDGMSWENYGQGKNRWSCDHIIALKSKNIDLYNKNDLFKVCHYTNLQPLWNVENISKGNK